MLDTTTVLYPRLPLYAISHTFIIRNMVEWNRQKLYFEMNKDTKDNNNLLRYTSDNKKFYVTKWHHKKVSYCSLLFSIKFSLKFIMHSGCFIFCQLHKRNFSHFWENHFQRKIWRNIMNTIIFFKLLYLKHF